MNASAAVRDASAPALVARPSVALAHRVIAHHSKSFALASRLLERRTRDQTAIVYAFCRRADDAVDLGADPARAVEALRTELDVIYTPSIERVTHPIAGAFAAVVRDRAIPRRYPDELLAGMAMDSTDTRYATVDELALYCHRVAGVVGLMMCHVFGVRDDDALVPAARLGRAMQLTNICRDVAEDWRRGRLYLPDELLAQHGAGGLAGELDVRELADTRRAPHAGDGSTITRAEGHRRAARALPRSAHRSLAGAIRELLALADREYRAAAHGIAALPWRAGLAVRAASAIYAAIGSRIRAAGCDVTAPRAVVPRRWKLALVAAAGARVLVSAPALAFTGQVRCPSRILEGRDVPLR